MLSRSPCKGENAHILARVYPSESLLFGSEISVLHGVYGSVFSRICLLLRCFYVRTNTLASCQLLIMTRLQYIQNPSC